MKFIICVITFNNVQPKFALFLHLVMYDNAGPDMHCMQ